MDSFLQQKIDDLNQKNLFRKPKGEWSEGFINFSANDYLGMARNPEVIAAGSYAIAKYGAGATASRMAGGNHPLYDELEEILAKTKRAEAACIFGSGYLANIGTIPALVEEGDLIIADKLSHSCLLEGSKLSGARLQRFNHNDLGHLQTLLAERKNFRNCLIITEEIFSMDGDRSPLEELRKIVEQNDCWLLVDGAHSLYEDKSNKLGNSEVYVGTLSKAIGAYGGYVCGSKTLITYLKTKAKSLIYTTALPPSVIATAIKALEVIKREKPYLKTMDNSRYLSSKLNSLISDSAIIPIILGDEEKALAAEQKLKEQKILVSAIRPPTVPKGSARLRISVSAAHDKSEIDLLSNWIKSITA